MKIKGSKTKKYLYRKLIISSQKSYKIENLADLNKKKCNKPRKYTIFKNSLLSSRSKKINKKIEYR